MTDIKRAQLKLYRMMVSDTADLSASQLLACARLSFFEQSSLLPGSSDVSYKKCKKKREEGATVGKRWEKHFEAERNFGVGVIDVFGRRVQGRGCRGEKRERSEG